MSFKIGIIGHPDINTQIQDLVLSKFNNVKLTNLDISDDNNFSDSFSKISNQFSQFDGLLFTAKDIYQIFHDKQEIEKPTIYLDSTEAELYRALFKGLNSFNNNLQNISVDSRSYNEVINSLENLDYINLSSNKVLVVDYDFTKPEYVKSTLENHIANYEKHNCLCLTGFTEIRNRLTEMNIPVVLLESDRANIIEKVNKLISSAISMNTRQNDQAVILISLSNLKEHIVIENSEHSVISAYNKITEKVFWFSQKVKGAFLSSDQKTYSIFCSREDFESNINGYTKFELLNEISKTNIVHASIGVGFGKTVQKAMKHATIARIKAIKENISCAFIKHSEREITGPMFPSGTSSGKTIVYDTKLNEIAEKSGLSISKIYRINGYIKEKNTSILTSKQLANLLEISQRSANRIIEKLVESHYVEQRGTKSEGDKGRPIRIFEFYF